MKASELVGKTLTVNNFDGIHKDKVLAFDGENFTLGIVFEKKIAERFVISPKELEFVYGVKVEV